MVVRIPCDTEKHARVMPLRNSWDLGTSLCTLLLYIQKGNWYSASNGGLSSSWSVFQFCLSRRCISCPGAFGIFRILSGRSARTKPHVENPAPVCSSSSAHWMSVVFEVKPVSYFLRMRMRHKFWRHRALFHSWAQINWCELFVATLWRQVSYRLRSPGEVWTGLKVCDTFWMFPHIWCFYFDSIQFLSGKTSREFWRSKEWNSWWTQRWWEPPRQIQESQ